MSRSAFFGSLSRFATVVRLHNGQLLKSPRQQLHPLVCTFSSFSNNEHDSSLQGHQEHEFSPSRSREILTAQAVYESGSYDINKELAKDQFQEVCEEGEPADRPYDAQGSVSLYSVMQTNVPEPFQASQMGNPTHMNMPGGGYLREEKFISDRYIQGTHPKRSYSTKAAPVDPGQDYGSVQGTQEIVSDVFTPHRPTTQGIQGEECVGFRLWLQNCAFYGLDCDRQAQDYISGRRSLTDIFAEQEQLIDEVVSQRQQPVSGEVGVQGVQENSYTDLLGAWEAPCPQGVQGETCEQFKLWLHNCGKYGTGIECEKAYRQLIGGRKTLHQLFQEQEALINKIQKRPYSSSSGDASDSQHWA